MSSGELRKYEYLTVEDLGYRPSVLEQTKSDYSPLGKVFNKGLDKDDHKEGLLKRLKNQNVNNNDKNNKTNDESKLSSAKSELSIYFTPRSGAKSESSKKTSINDDKHERSVYFPNVANMEGINILEPKNETNFF